MLYLEIRPLSLKGERCRAHRAGRGQLSVGKDSAGLGPDRISPKSRTHMAGSVESPALSLMATSQLKWRGVFFGLTWMRALSAAPSDSFSRYPPCLTSGLSKQRLLMWPLSSSTIYLALQIIHEHCTVLSTRAVMENPAVMLDPVVSHLFATKYLFCYAYLLEPMFWNYKNDYQLLSPHCVPGTVLSPLYTWSHVIEPSQ